MPPPPAPARAPAAAAAARSPCPVQHSRPQGAGYRAPRERLGARFLTRSLGYKKKSVSLAPMMDERMRRQWAPVGKTPTVHHFDRRDRVSAISGISVSPCRQRLNLYFQLYTDNIRQEQARDFLRQLL
jgi:hypothetical protein